MGEEAEAVRCRDVKGRLRDIVLTDAGTYPSPGSVLEQRVAKTASGQVLIRKFVPRTLGARNPRYYDLLENEVRAGTRLGQVYDGWYPPQLASLVGYNMDVEEPFVLLRLYTGSPAAGLVNRFDDAESREFQIDLLRALQLTAAAGVVHGAVTLDAVRWDGTGLQLVDFESAEQAGEARRGGSGSPVRSPEQTEGSGVVDVRDDLWAAGLLIREVVMGAITNGVRPDLGRDPERLRALLDGVFAPMAAQRPYPAELLHKLRASMPAPPLIDADADLTEGRRLFEQVSRSKREQEEAVAEVRAASVERSAVERSAGRPVWLLPFAATMLVIATLIVVLAVR